MRAQKLLKRIAMILLIICVFFMAIDLFKVLKINIDFMNIKSSSRISSSSSAPEVRYEPSKESLITNAEDVLEEVKKLTLELKEEYMNSEEKQNFFEIANIHKIKNLFYDYEKYAVVKYKLLNIVDYLPKLQKETVGYTDLQLENYFINNSMDIEFYYGITQSSEFLNFVKSLSFLNGTKIDSVTLETSTINFDYDNDFLKFSISIKNNDGITKRYYVSIDYYKSNNNQIKPYLKITC